MKYASNKTTSKMQACHLHRLLLVFCGSCSVFTTRAFPQHTVSIAFVTRHNQQSEDRTQTWKRYGWLRDFFEPPNSSQTRQSNEIQYPELYPATYDLNSVVVEDDNGEAVVVRPLLKNTQLESRSLTLVYDANKDGWNPSSFHSNVDGKGAAIVLAKTSEGLVCGGYNPKGWASLGGARPSVAAFLFYQATSEDNPSYYQKLRKVGGGSLSCTRDDGGFGISFGPDGFVVPLRKGEKERLATSRLGPYFERGPEELQSLFDSDGAAELVELKVLVGKYDDGEDFPYSGGVLDCPGN